MMPPRDVVHFAERLKMRHLECIESVLYYPHPFDLDGVVVVFRNNNSNSFDLVSRVYDCRPADFLVYCLRLSELFELSLPSVMEGRAHMPYWLKYRGIVLFGQDIREKISLPPDPRVLLDNQLEKTRFHARSLKILQRLIDKEYHLLMDDLDRHLRLLMATALLIHNEWQVNLQTLPELFDRRFDDERLRHLWKEFRRIVSHHETGDQDVCRKSALEVVWLFEMFIRRLGAYAC